MRKKVKKVIKGLEKASMTHAKQAKILKSGLKVIKARGGRDASQADFSSPSGSSSSGGRGPSARDKAMGMGGKSRNTGATGTGSGSQNKPTQPSGSKVTVRKGPVQVPNIGLTAMAFNTISKSLYDAKNLKEQKKVDALGGEMLTQGKRSPKNTGGGDDGRNNQPVIQKKPTLMAQTPSVPMPLQKVKPKMFEFNFNEGGLVRGVGKILKDKKRKVRIF